MPAHNCPQCGGPYPGVRLANHRYGRGKPVHDPMYTGPAGHCPPGLCLECWAAHWSACEARALNGGEWTMDDMILWMMCRGYTRTEIASTLCVDRKTVYWLLKDIKRGKIDIPVWLEQIAEQKAACGYYDGVKVATGPFCRDTTPFTKDAVGPLDMMPYTEYLNSPTWKRIRRRAVKDADYACAECGVTGVTLEVHHLCYPKRGTERPEDLLVLCHKCHQRIHDK